MSARVTRKRARAQDEEEDLPPAKREPDQEQDDPEGAGAEAGNALEAADGQAKNGQGWKEDEEFWFEDGTVILVARDVEFRVYKGVLAGLSSVFKALFADRGHAMRNIRMDEEQALLCPVVHVSESPEDLRHLLRACFSKRLGSLYEERDPSYHEVSAAIRLGDKYKITELYSQSLAYLKRYFPSTFDSWITLEDYDPPSWLAADGVGAVNLARMTAELSILPSAFVACICATSTGPDDLGIGHGIAREDGSRERLSPEDLTVCLNGKTSLRTATITAVFRTFKPVVSPACKTSSTCKRAIRDVLLNLGHNVEYLQGGNPFAGYEDFVESADLDLCPACTTMVGERSLKERKGVWDRLPELLGIDVPGWGELPPQGDAK
ncbi:hypothetical protein LXA43DRAFT_40087 [Ganoderma leucocontextum]|nr:hypothetical protein LXA43DRAFT_40087 [Ganoderma leucocontextum]